MRIPPLALPLLNAARLVHLNTSGIPVPSSNAPVFCYQQRPPDRPQRPITTYHDCMLLARRLVSSGKPYAQMDFSRDPEMGFKTPYRLYGGTCVFEVDIDPEQTREKSWAASYHEIGIAAIEILAPCVVQPPHLGGVTKVGRDLVLDFRLYGLSIFKSTA